MSGLGLLLALFWIIQLVLRSAQNDSGPHVDELDHSSGRVLKEPPPLPTHPVGGDPESAIHRALEDGTSPALEGVLGSHRSPRALQSFWVHHLALRFKASTVSALVDEVPQFGNAWVLQALNFAQTALVVRENPEQVEFCQSSGWIACGHAAALGSDDLTATPRALLMAAGDDWDHASSFMLEHLARSQDVMAAIAFTTMIGRWLPPTAAIGFARRLAQRSAGNSGLHVALFVAHREAVCNSARTARTRLFEHVEELNAAELALRTWQADGRVEAYVWSYVASVYSLLEDATPTRAALERVENRFVYAAWISDASEPSEAFSIARAIYCD